MQIGKRFGHGIRIGVAAAVFMALAPPGSAQDGGAMVEWPAFGNDLIDLTPELLAEAKKIAAGFHMGPLFTPPSTGAGTLMLPSAGGGANWPGAAVDPETGVLYVPSSTSISVHPLAKPDPARSNLDYVGSFFANAGGPRGLPLVKPPWTSRRKRWGR